MFKVIVANQVNLAWTEMAIYLVEDRTAVLDWEKTVMSNFPFIEQQFNDLMRLNW